MEELSVAWLIVICLLILIVFIPLPLYLTFRYEKNKLNVYIYNIKVYPTKETKKDIKEPKRKTLYPKKVYLRIIRYIYIHSNHTLFKSTLKFKSHISYGLDDPCTTAILYGVLHSASEYFYLKLSDLFRVKDFDISITPVFNKSMFELKIKSIIFINLAKIIYITLLIYVSFKKGSKKYLRPKEAI
jgi:hypothetical protein